MRESYIEKKVCEYAKSLDWFCKKWKSPSHRGVPDRICFKNGRVILIEFKAPGKKPTPFQKRIHEKFLEKGQKVEVIDNIEQGKQLFKEK